MRLIDADALIKVIQQNDYMLTAKHNSMAPGMFTSGIRQAVDESQTIDPVKHGKWEDENPIEPNPMFRAKVCSVCGRTEGSPNDFCPYCGARMDGEV